MTEYQSYVENQIRRAKKTRKQTMKYERRRVWIHERMKQLGVTGQSVLCVGARHGSEVEFFERSGFQADGIDLYAANKIIKCDMSKMLENEYLKDRQYDIVFAHNSLEHCADFDGFLTGLNQICRRYFVCSVPFDVHAKVGLDINGWDCNIHKFMTEDKRIEQNLLEAFPSFEIVIAEIIKGKRLFFILKKKPPVVVNDFGPQKQWRSCDNVDDVVLSYIIDNYHVKSMIDIGCGRGKQVESARQLGLDAKGVDGSVKLRIYHLPYFVRHDYTKGTVDLGHFDLAWSVEFVEHVYEKYVHNFMDTFAKCKYAFISHAVPGQHGTHHVNCQNDAYWIKVFGSYGFVYDEVTSMKLRKIARNGFVAATAMFFTNSGLGQLKER